MSRQSQNDAANDEGEQCQSKTYAISQRSFTNSRKREALTEPQLCKRRISYLRRPYTQFMNWNLSKGE